MKILVASDIHGSKFYTEKLLQIFENDNYDKLILLGDIYYHGPRNSLTEEYNPMEVANILNKVKDKLIVIRGNCDAEVDQMISEFIFQEKQIIELNNKKIFLTHGHKYNPSNIPEEQFDILFYGHTHVNKIEKINEKLYINPGSISLPKGNTQNSYIEICDDILEIRDFNGNIINSVDLI